MHDNLRIDISYVIVTGGSSGLGYNISKKLIENGFGVISMSPRASSYEVSLENFVPINCDTSDEREMQLALGKLANRSINVTSIVNNAGKSKWNPIENLNKEFLDDMFTRNVYTAVTTVQTALKNFTTITSIVNISSLAGKRGTPNNSAYVACKFAINGLTQAWCKELGPSGIRVNAVCPVLIKTPGLLAEISNTYGPAREIDSDVFLKNFAENETALKRLPEGEDVAELVLFLLSDKAKNLSGQCINVDCGVLPG